MANVLKIELLIDNTGMKIRACAPHPVSSQDGASISLMQRRAGAMIVIRWSAIRRMAVAVG